MSSRNFSQVSASLSFADVKEAFARTTRIPGRSPELIYHYTSADSLLGILDTDAIWASQIRYLNDAAELLYAAGLMAEVLESHISGSREPARSALRAVYGAVTGLEHERFLYAASFSEEGDLLSQWRAYGDAGGGYALGIKIGDVKMEPSSPIVRRVQYDRRRQREALDRLVSKLEERAGIRLSEAAEDELVRGLLADFALTGAFFKHGSFQEEREWRALTIASEDQDAILFRAAGGIIIPFVPIVLKGQQDGGRIPLGRVVCGPTLQPTLSRRAVQLALRLRGHERCEVDSSRVPLRVRLE